MIVIAVGKLNLGNNYSYDNFIDALSDTQIERIYNKGYDLDSDIRIVGRGNYGKVTLNTCGSDLNDYLRGL
jgi:hypothetical protein